MYQFESWIEDDNKNYFITKKDLTSEQAKALIKKNGIVDIKGNIATCKDILNSEGKAEYNKIWQIANNNYQKVIQDALAECKKAHQTALHEYQKVHIEFWKIAKQKKYRLKELNP